MRFSMPIVRLAATGLFAFTTSAVSAETITVCASGCDHTSINAAIDAASDGDVIQLAAETYTEGSVIDTDGKAITLRGATDKNGDPTSILDGGGTHPVLCCDTQSDETTAVEDLLIQNGYGEEGGAYPYRMGGGLVATGAGVVNVRNCTVRKCTGDYSAFVAHSSVDASLEDCVFTDNVAPLGAIMVWLDNECTLLDCVVSGNHADTTYQAGGGISSLGGSVTATDCLFTANSSAGSGGAVALLGTGPLTFEGCTFTQNSAEGSGGAIWSERRAQLDLSNCTITDNSADYGGGLFLEGGLRYDNQPNTFTNCTVSGNSAEQDGGGIMVVGIAGLGGLYEVILADTAVEGNTPNNVKAIPYNDEDVMTITVVNTAVVAGDLDGDGDYDEDDARIAMADFGITEASDPVAGDADGDGDVDADDRTAVNDALGLCAADIDGDGQVDGADLSYILGFWGVCSAP